VLSLQDHVIACCGYSFPGIQCETWNHKGIPATVPSTTYLERKDNKYHPLWMDDRASQKLQFVGYGYTFKIR